MCFLFQITTPTSHEQVRISASSVDKAGKACRQLYPDATIAFLGVATIPDTF
jgi:hypothetical protein